MLAMAASVVAGERMVWKQDLNPNDLKKICEDDIKQEPESVVSKNEEDKLIHIEDRLGTFKQSLSIHDKYKG